MRSRMYGLLAAGVVHALASTSALAAGTPGLCASSKLGTTAKYAKCRLTAYSKSAKAAMSPDFSAMAPDYSKCSLDSFAAAEAKAGTGVCPTESDQALVQGYLDECTSRAGNWLAGGGGLPETCQADLAVCQTDCVASVGATLRTGQTTFHGAGSDGDLEKGAARSFTDNGDGTITDHTTGLMWEKKSDDGSIHDKDNAYTWSTGSWNLDGTVQTTFLATLNGGSGFAGHTDWRIPNRNELLSLIQLESVMPSTYPEFNNGCSAGCTVETCSCTKSRYYWTSSTNDVVFAWFVSFADGYLNVTDKRTQDIFVRAVRAGS